MHQKDQLDRSWSKQFLIVKNKEEKEKKKRQ
jgi:hypothetical protein